MEAPTTETPDKKKKGKKKNNGGNKTVIKQYFNGASPSGAYVGALGGPEGTFSQKENPQINDLRKVVEELTKRVEALSSTDKTKKVDGPITPEGGRTIYVSPAIGEAESTAPPPEPPPPPQSTETPEQKAQREEAERVKKEKDAIAKAQTDDESVIMRHIQRNRGYDAQNKLKEDLGSLTQPGKMFHQTTREMQEKSMPYADKMYKAEREYFKALREFHKGRGALSVRVGDKLKYGEVTLPQEVNDLKQTWMQSRSEYAGFLKQSAADRQNYVEDGSKKFGNTSKKWEGMSDEQKQKVLKRYGRIKVAREVILGAEEAQLRAKEDGLKLREKTFIDRRLDWFKNKVSPSTKLLIGSALMGGLGTAAIAGGSVFGLLGTVMAVPSAIYALRAMFTKDQAKKDKFNKTSATFAKFTVGGLFGMLGAAGTRKTHEVLKTQEKADKKLKNRSGLGDLGDVGTLSNVSAGRSKALLAGENMKRDEGYARFGSALVGGMATGAAISEFAPQVGATVAAIPGEVNTFATGIPAEVNGLTGHLGIGHIPFGGGTGTEHIPPGEHLSIGDNIDGVHINDADKLLGHFAKQIQAHHPNTAGHDLPAVKKFYSLLEKIDKKGHVGFLSREDSAARQLGLETHNGSAIMQPKDTISIYKGEIVVDRAGAHPMHHVLIDASGKLNKLTLKDWPHSTEHFRAHQATTHTEAARAVEQPASSPSAPPDISSVSHESVATFNGAHKAALKQIVENQRTLNEHSKLVEEYAKAKAISEHGFRTQADKTTYNDYLEQLKTYNQAHPNQEAIVSQTHGVSNSPQPTAAAAQSNVEVIPTPTQPDHLSTQVPPNPAETATAPASPEQGTNYESLDRDAYLAAVEKAQNSPIGTEIPYVAHAGSQPLWNAVVSDPKGQTHLETLIDSANGRPLPPPK
jgi:hypothetical protein